MQYRYGQICNKIFGSNFEKNTWKNVSCSSYSHWAKLKPWYVAFFVILYCNKNRKIWHVACFELVSSFLCSKGINIWIHMSTEMITFFFTWDGLWYGHLPNFRIITIRSTFEQSLFTCDFIIISSRLIYQSTTRQSQ